MSKYFGTDGIRGILGTDYSCDFLYRVGRSIKVLSNRRVVIGYDTRNSSDLYCSLITSGVVSIGCDCYIAKVVSTPALISYSKNHNMIGIMITASHNPYYYNGIKIINCGEKLSEIEQNSLELFIDNDDNIIEYGKIYNINILNEYYKEINKYSVKTGFNVIVDTSNGSASKMVYKALRGSCDKLDIINDNPDGFNINKNCGSTNIDNLINYIKLGDYDVGFSFDGDADRVIMCDGMGNIYDGDIIIYILARYLNIDKVVLSVMSNIGIIEALNNHNIEVVEAKVGDRYIYQQMNNKDIVLGGEESGHIIYKEVSNTGDGILMALLLLKVIKENNIDLKEIRNEINLYSSLSYNLNVDNINEDVYPRIEEIKKEMGKCKIILRKSGTENVVRLMVMGKRLDLCLKYIEEIKKMILN